MSMASDFATKFYIPSKDPRIQALFAGTYQLPGPELDPQVREDTAKKLSAMGLAVDENIDANGGDAYETMQQRQRDGWSRFPSLAQELANPSEQFDKNDPNLAFKVSVDPVDYPKFSGPVPPTVLYVGAYAGNGLYNAINGAEKVFSTGQEHTENGLMYTFLPAVALGEYFWEFVGKA